MSKFIWKPVVKYCRQGTDHINKGLPCQDYVDAEEHEDYAVIAMADGLSSLYNSQHAARTAVRGTIAWFRQYIDEIKRMVKNDDEDLAYIRRNLIPVLQKMIADAAYLGGMPLETMDCTLTFVLLVKPKTGGDFAYCGVLGDGAICVVTENPETKETEAGTLTGRSTVAAATDTIMSQDAQERLTVFRQSIEAAKVFGFLLTTDGLDGAVYKKGSSMTYQMLERFYNVTCLPDPNEGLKCATDELVKIPVFSDDISIAVLSRDSEPRRFPDDPYWLCRCEYKNQLNTSTCIRCGSDYLTMYSHVDKSGYKNEADFFRKLNADPDKQRRILGMLTEETEEMDYLDWSQSELGSQIPVKTESLENQIPIEKPAKNPGKKRKTEQVPESDRTAMANGREILKTEPEVVSRWSGIGRWTLRCAVVAIVLCFFTTLNMYMANRFQAKSVATIREMLQKHNMSSEEEILELTVELEDGSIYIGGHKNGIPNGYGMLIRGRMRESGQFVDGEPDGLFLVADLKDPLTYRVKVYDEKGVREWGPFAAPAPDADEKKVDHQTPLLREPDVESEQIGILLPGETVYLTNDYVKIELDDGLVKLCQVHTAYGYVGWCNAEAFDNLYE